MRTLICLLGLSFLVAGPAAADPPDWGFVGAIVYEDGREPPRFACDRLDLVKTIYDAGKDNLFAMRPKYDELAVTRGVYGDAQCTIGRYAEVKVIEPPVLLGPVANPVGDAELFFWAIHVDNSPKGAKADYWVLYLDTRDERPWLQVGEAA